MNTVLEMKNRWLYGYRMFVSVPVVYPSDYMADWELRLTATAQRHKTVPYHKSPAWEKIKIQNSKYSFVLCTEYVLLLHTVKLKNCKLNHFKSGTFFRTNLN